MSLRAHLEGTTGRSLPPPPFRRGEGWGEGSVCSSLVVPPRCAPANRAHLVTTTTTTGTLRLRGRINGPEKIAHPGMFRPFCRVNAAFLSSATSCSLVVLTRCARIAGGGASRLDKVLVNA